MITGPILIIGSGHLASRISRLARRSGYDTRHLAASAFPIATQDDSAFEATQQMLHDLDLGTQAMTYVVDDSDERNLEIVITLLSLKKDLHLTVSFSNEHIAPHLRAAHPNVCVLNPARLAAATFVNALDAPISRSLKYAPAPPPQPSGRRVTDPLIWVLAGLFVTLVTAAIAYFHAAEQLSWVDSTYFVIVTVATVGYGDINLLNASATSKLIGVGLILGSTFFIWMIFSLTIDRIIKKRVQLALGRRKYTLEHHVVLCGLGRLGYFIAEALLERGEKLLIIEQSEHTAAVEHFRSRGAAVYIGDARALGVLQDVAISEAKALFAVISNDYVNLEIGLNARSLKPDLRLVLRVFDHSMSEMIKENLDIHLTFSMSAIVDQQFLDSAGPGVGLR